MAIREILLPLVSYPLAVEDAAIKKSVSVAAHLKAQITAVSFDVDIRSLGGSYTRPFPTDGPTLETPEQKQSLKSADHMMAIFDTAARACGVGFHKTIKRCVRQEFPSYLAFCARTFDISLVPVRPFDELHEKVLEELIFQSGRPLLIFLGEMADRLPSSFEHAAIAWDHSQQATRAVADAMWLLQNVKTVRVFTVSDNETPAERESGEVLIKHLGAHGIKAQFEVIPKGIASIGK